MKSEQSVNILYDMALVIGGETHVKPLITKTLQRLLYHAAMPCGFFISIAAGDDNAAIGGEVSGDEAVIMSAWLEAAVGDSRLMNQVGGEVRLPVRVLAGEIAYLNDDPDAKPPAGLDALFDGATSYSVILRLPAPGVGVFFLCSSRKLRADFPSIDLFKPVLANFSKAYALCRGNAESILRLGKHIERYMRLAGKLERREAHMRMILDNVVDGIITVDEKSIIRSFNPAAEEIFGYRMDEVVGQKVAILIPEHLRNRHDAYIEKYLATGERNIIGVPMDLVGRRKDGSHFLMNIAVGRLPHERPAMFTAIIRDVTEAKRAEEALRKSERRLREAQRIGRIGDWSLDVASGELRWSDEVYHIFGYQPGECRPSYEAFFRAVHPEDVASVKQSEQRALSDGTKHSIDHRIVLPGGEMRWVHEEAEAMVDEGGAVHYLAGTVHDITERKRIEAEAIAAKEEAERANNAKSEFLSRMSHELRTPLNSILGFAQLAMLTDSIDAETRELVEEIFNAGNHLLDLINEMLDLARIEAGHINLCIESVPLALVLEECLAIARPLAAVREIQFEIDSGPCQTLSVAADRMRLKQVLLNLLSNAVKYNVERGMLRVACEERGDGFLRISVSDTGPGIPVEKHSQLFEPFSRLGAERSQIQGTGIGLALSKRMIECMQGRIGFDSAVGRGSTFWVELAMCAGDEARAS